MSSATYYDLIDSIFNEIEERLEELEQDPDIATAEGVINVTFRNGVVFVFSRQPPTEQLWLATPGGGFHYEWDLDHNDWRDTKSGDLFRPFLVAQLAEYALARLSW
mgnify:CR=1 FL=1